MLRFHRNFFLFLSKNKMLNACAKRWGIKLGASKIVAGETIESAMATVKNLNEKGMLCTVDHLGEFVKEKEKAEEASEYCVKTIQAITDHEVDCQLSLKLTQLGLDIDRSLCVRNLKNILTEAKKNHIFVCIDMEDYAHYEQTLHILNELRHQFDNVGTVIQAYLYRAHQDLDHLKGIPLRLVKGAYKESQDVAWQDKAKVDANFMSLIEKHLLNHSFTAIATHDHRIIQKVKTFVHTHNISRDSFEFQMLYGFRHELQQQLVDEGYSFRTYVPFGRDWYGYFMRRLAERPQNLVFAFKGFLSK